MADFIDREAAENLFYAVDPENDGSDGGTIILLPGTYNSAEIGAMLESLPAADVAPVVRCRDCRNSYEGIDGRICSFGPCVDCVVPDDFFCSLGERRAENASKEM